MKITPKQIAEVSGGILGLGTEFIQTHANAVKKEGRYKNFEKRMRWDLFYLARQRGLIPRDVFADDVLDSHIDTALRKIMRQHLPEFA